MKSEPNPLTPLENEVIGTVHSSIAEAIKGKLGGYGSALDKFIAAAVNKHETELQSMLDSAIGAALRGDFADALADACTRKLAKVLISKMEGALEKQVGELRSSPEFRARLTVAVDEIVKSLVVSK